MNFNICNNKAGFCKRPQKEESQASRVQHTDPKTPGVHGLSVKMYEHQGEAGKTVQCWSEEKACLKF